MIHRYIGRLRSRIKDTDPQEIFLPLFQSTWRRWSATVGRWYTRWRSGRRQPPTGVCTLARPRMPPSRSISFKSPVSYSTIRTNIKITLYFPHSETQVSRFGKWPSCSRNTNTYSIYRLIIPIEVDIILPLIFRCRHSRLQYVEDAGGANCGCVTRCREAAGIIETIWFFGTRICDYLFLFFVQLFFFLFAANFAPKLNRFMYSIY